MVPERAEADTQVTVHPALSQLRSMDGASQLEALTLVRSPAGRPPREPSG